MCDIYGLLMSPEISIECLFNHPHQIWSIILRKSLLSYPPRSGDLIMAGTVQSAICMSPGAEMSVELS